MPNSVRRFISISVVTCTALTTGILLPFTTLLAVMVDARHLPVTRWPSLRANSMFFLYTWVELIGLILAGLLWIISGGGLWVSNKTYYHWNFTLQSQWNITLLHLFRIIFSMRIHIAPQQDDADMPFLCFPRHASLADTLLPGFLLRHPALAGIRFVLKKELLWDPCIDI